MNLKEKAAIFLPAVVLTGALIVAGGSEKRSDPANLLADPFNCDNTEAKLNKDILLKPGQRYIVKDYLLYNSNNSLKFVHHGNIFDVPEGGIGLGAGPIPQYSEILTKVEMTSFYKVEPSSGGRNGVIARVDIDCGAEVPSPNMDFPVFDK
jgi:hypothetical protein